MKKAHFYGVAAAAMLLAPVAVHAAEPEEVTEPNVEPAEESQPEIQDELNDKENVPEVITVESETPTVITPTQNATGQAQTTEPAQEEQEGEIEESQGADPADSAEEEGQDRLLTGYEVTVPTTPEWGDEIVISDIAYEKPDETVILDPEVFTYGKIQISILTNDYSQPGPPVSSWQSVEVPFEADRLSIAPMYENNGVFFSYVQYDPTGYEKYVEEAVSGFKFEPLTDALNLARLKYSQKEQIWKVTIFQTGSEFSFQTRGDNLPDSEGQTPPPMPEEERTQESILNAYFSFDPILTVTIDGGETQEVELTRDLLSAHMGTPEGTLGCIVLETRPLLEKLGLDPVEYTTTHFNNSNTAYIHWDSRGIDNVWTVLGWQAYENVDLHADIIKLPAQITEVVNEVKSQTVYVLNTTDQVVTEFEMIPDSVSWRADEAFGEDGKYRVYTTVAGDLYLEALKQLTGIDFEFAEYSTSNRQFCNTVLLSQARATGVFIPNEETGIVFYVNRLGDIPQQPLVPEEPEEPDTEEKPDQPGTSTPETPDSSDKPGTPVEEKPDPAPSSDFESGEVSVKVLEGDMNGLRLVAERMNDPLIISTLPEGTEKWLVYDIYFADEKGNEVHRSGRFEGSIELPAGFDPSNVHIFHQEPDGQLKELACKVIDGKIVFETDSFSLYLVTSARSSDRVLMVPADTGSGQLTVSNVVYASAAKTESIPSSGSETVKSSGSETVKTAFGTGLTGWITILGATMLAWAGLKKRSK